MTSGEKAILGNKAIRGMPEENAVSSQSLMSKHFPDELSSAKMMVVMLTTSLLLTGTTLALPADPPHVYDAPVSHSFHPDPAEVRTFLISQ